MEDFFRAQIDHIGLSQRDFARIARNGFGDQLNSYPHSMAWFQNRLYVGTTRSNLCLFKVSKISKKIDRWPVECPESPYDQDMRAQIWRFDAETTTPAVENSGWTEVARSPWIISDDGQRLPREFAVLAPPPRQQGCRAAGLKGVEPAWVETPAAVGRRQAAQRQPGDEDR